jgi:hypothetical protein
MPSKKRYQQACHHILLIQDVLVILPAADIRALTLTRELVGGKFIDWRGLGGVVV